MHDVGYVGRKAATRRHSEWHNKRAAAIAKAAAARGKGRGKGKKDALSEGYPTKRTPGVMYRAFLNILDTLPRDRSVEPVESVESFESVESVESVERWPPGLA